MTFVNYNIERNHAQKFGTSYFIFYHLHSIRNLQFTLLLSNQYLKSLCYIQVTVSYGNFFLIFGTEINRCLQMFKDHHKPK